MATTQKLARFKQGTDAISTFAELGGWKDQDNLLDDLGCSQEQASELY